jgi:hypothetical protein
MPAGLTLPFVTAADPDRAGEGSLDPLGLARIADRLADSLAPEVTARMSRIRFLTAIAVSAHVLEASDLTGPAGTPAYLAFEWHLVEALVRVRPETGTDAVPGIQKARSRLRDRRRHLDGPSYLETPKVFGFHGVYKRLAKDLEVVDDELGLLGDGEKLLATWERDQGLGGFLDRRRGTAGGKFASTLAGELRRALQHESVQLGPTSRWWREISRTLAPGAARRPERRCLWRWLTDARHSIRREVAELVADQDLAGRSEREMVGGFLGAKLSSELKERLLAVAAFEALVKPLDDGFRLLRSVATQRIPLAVAPSTVAEHPKFQSVAQALPDAFKVATERLAALDLATDLEQALGPLAERMPREQLVEAILDRHDAVQASKQKRSWFERDERGFAVRGIGRLDEPFTERVEYLHPYRMFALRAFAQDLHAGGAGA